MKDENVKVYYENSVTKTQVIKIYYRPLRKNIFKGTIKR